MPGNKKGQLFLKKYNKPLLWILVAMIMTPFFEIPMAIMKHFRLENLTYTDTMSLLVLKTPNILVGSFVALFNSAWSMLFMYYGSKFLATDYFPLKAMFLNMSWQSWIYIIYGILGRNERLILSVGDNFIHASLAAISGLIVGLMMRKFLFQKTVSQKGDKVKYDKPLMAMLFGIIPIPLLEGFTQLMKYLGVTKLSLLEMLSLMWVKEPTWLLGILAMLGVGSWIGLIIYQSGKLFGTDYFLLKAILIETTLALLLFEIFGTLGKNVLLIPNISSFFVHVLSAMFGGASTGFLIKKLFVDDI